MVLKVFDRVGAPVCLPIDHTRIEKGVPRFTAALEECSEISLQTQGHYTNLARSCRKSMPSCVVFASEDTISCFSSDSQVCKSWIWCQDKAKFLSVPLFFQVCGRAVKDLPSLLHTNYLHNAALSLYCIGCEGPVWGVKSAPHMGSMEDRPMTECLSPELTQHCGHYDTGYFPSRVDLIGAEGLN